MTEEIERLTVERASAEQIRAVAIQQGMITPPRRRPGEDPHGHHVHRGSGEGGEVTMSMTIQDEDDVQIPIPELLGVLLDAGRLRPAPDGGLAAGRARAR